MLFFFTSNYFNLKVYFFLILYFVWNCRSDTYDYNVHDIHFPTSYFQSVCVFELQMCVFKTYSLILRLIQCDNVWLFVGLFNPFTFNIIIDTVEFTSDICYLFFVSVLKCGKSFFLLLLLRFSLSSNLLWYIYVWSILILCLWFVELLGCVH